MLYFCCGNVVTSASTFKTISPPWSVKIWEISFSSSTLFLSWWFNLYWGSMKRKKQQQPLLFILVLTKSNKGYTAPKGPKAEAHPSPVPGWKLHLICAWLQGAERKTPARSGRWAFNWKKVKRSNSFWALCVLASQISGWESWLVLFVSVECK